MLILSTKLSPSKFNKSCWITLIVLLHTSFLGGPRSELKWFLFDVENFCIYLIDIKPHFDVHKHISPYTTTAMGWPLGKKLFFSECFSVPFFSDGCFKWSLDIFYINNIFLFSPFAKKIESRNIFFAFWFFYDFAFMWNHFWSCQIFLW